MGKDKFQKLRSEFICIPNKKKKYIFFSVLYTLFFVVRRRRKLNKKKKRFRLIKKEVVQKKTLLSVFLTNGPQKNKRQSNFQNGQKENDLWNLQSFLSFFVLEKNKTKVERFKNVFATKQRKNFLFLLLLIWLH